MDPPVSLASAAGMRPAATAAADPPLDPPLMKPGCHGLRVPAPLGRCRDAPAELVRSRQGHTAEGSADPKGSLATRRRCPAVPTRSSLRQVLNAAEDVVADRGGHLILISVFKCPDKRVVLPNRFLVRPPGLRAVRERPP